MIRMPNNLKKMNDHEICTSVKTTSLNMLKRNFAAGLSKYIQICLVHILRCCIVVTYIFVKNNNIEQIVKIMQQN